MTFRLGRLATAVGITIALVSCGAPPTAQPTGSGSSAAESKYEKYDLPKAKALMKAAGFANGFDINLSTFSTPLDFPAMAALILYPLAYGLVISFFKTYLPSSLTSYRDAFVFVILILLLLVRPGGILGTTDRDSTR